MGAFIRKLNKNFHADEEGEKETIVTYPSFFNANQKQALKDACHIGGISNPVLVSESEATIACFAEAHSEEFKEDERITVFVDIGWSQTTVTCAKLQLIDGKRQASLIHSDSDQNIGGRDMDWLLHQLVIRSVQDGNEEFSFEPMKQKKQLLKLLNGVQKAREALSADDEAVVQIDEFCDDIDIDCKLSIGGFNAEIASINERLQDFLDKVIEDLQQKGIGKAGIHRIELLGDGTRTPLFKETIQNKFEKDNLSRTLHSTEAIAKGASIIGAKRGDLVSNLELEGFDPQEQNRDILQVSDTVEDYTEKEKEFEAADTDIRDQQAFRYLYDSKGVAWIAKEWKRLFNQDKKVQEIEY